MIDYRPYQFNFMLLGPDRPKFWQMPFNNDTCSLRTLVPALLWEGLNHFLNASDEIPVVLLLTSKYDSTLQTNMFIARDERVSCWRWNTLGWRLIENGRSSLQPHTNGNQRSRDYYYPY